MVLLSCHQVHEQVGELLVHCYYGCVVKDDHTNPEVDPNGMITSCDYHVTIS